MPEWLFVSYLVLSFISLVITVSWAQWQAASQDRPSAHAIGNVAFSLASALVLEVPLFYLVYAGMVPRWGSPFVYLGANLLVPLGWAHMAVFAWGAGQTYAERYAVGTAFFLAVPVLFLGIAVGVSVNVMRLALWVLLLTGLTVWMRSRLSSSA